MIRFAKRFFNQKTIGILAILILLSSFSFTFMNEHASLTTHSSHSKSPAKTTIQYPLLQKPSITLLSPYSQDSIDRYFLNPNTGYSYHQEKRDANPKLAVQTSPDPATVIEVLRGSTLEIKGNLKAANVEQYWNGETVKLYWNTTKTDITNAYSANDQSYLSNHYISSAVTSGYGNWTFSVSIPNDESGLLGQLGTQTFVVWYEGNPSLGYGSGATGGSTIIVYGGIYFQTSANPSSLEAHIQESFSVTASLVFDNNSAVINHPSNVLVSFTETRINVNNAGTTTTSLAFSSGSVTYTSSVDSITDPASLASVDITADFTSSTEQANLLTGNLKFFKILTSTADLTKSYNFTITRTQAIFFYVQNPITGVFEESDTNSFNYTDNVVLRIRFIDYVGGTPTGISDTFSVSYVYNSVTYNLQSRTTDTYGNVTFSVNLNKTAFPNPVYRIQFIIQLQDTSPYLYLKPASGSVTRYAYIIGQIGTVTASLVNTTKSYFPGDAITVTGSVVDVDGDPAYDAIVQAKITGLSDTVNPPVTTLTASDGSYSITVPIPTDTSLTQDTYTITITVLPRTLSTTTTRDGLLPHIWLIVTSATATTTTFNFVYQITVKLDSYTLSSTSTDANPDVSTTMFNVSLGEYITNDTTFTVTVLDQANRVPIGANFSLLSPLGSQSYSGVVTTINNGVFTFDPILQNTNAYNLLLNKEHRGYTLVFTLQYMQGTTLSGSFTHSYLLTGPDLTAPTFEVASHLQTPVNSESLNGQRVPHYQVNISIIVQDGGTYKTGIRYVQLYFEIIHENGSVLVPYQNVTMQFNGYSYYYAFSRTFLENLVSDLNQTTLQYYFVAYDYAGYGLLPDNSRSTTPLYNASISNMATLGSAGSPFTYLLGDHEAPDYTESTDTYINGKPITQELQLQYVNDINITIYLVDNGGITQVNITYRLRTITLDENGNIINATAWSDNITGSMVLISGTIYNGYWMFIIPKSLLDYNTQIDFALRIKDAASNVQAKYFSVNPNNPASALNAPRIIDVTPPNLLGQPVYVDDQGNTFVQGGTVFTNETIELRLRLNETQTGLNTSSLTITVKYLYNGNAFLITQVPSLLTSFGNGTYEVIFFVPLVPAQYQDKNVQIQILFSAKDNSNNELSYTGGYFAQALSFPEAGGVPVEQNPTVVTAIVEGNNTRTYILVGVFLALVIGFVLFYNKEYFLARFQQSSQQRRLQGTLNEFLEEIARLGTEGKYRRAIIRSFEALERIARERLQEPRLHSQTVREYIDTLAETSPVDYEVLYDLAQKFEKAKYGNEQLSIEDFDVARNALKIAAETIISYGGQNL